VNLVRLQFFGHEVIKVRKVIFQIICNKQILRSQFNLIQVNAVFRGVRINFWSSIGDLLPLLGDFVNACVEVQKAAARCVLVNGQFVQDLTSLILYVKLISDPQFFQFRVGSPGNLRRFIINKKAIL